MILDVGCGSLPKGDVNCDRYTGLTTHRSGTIIQVKRINNFVNCCAEYLPFRTDGFDKVVCNHVLEHLKLPYLALNELIRVSNNEINFVVPHRYARLQHLRGGDKKVHIHFFTKNNILNWLDRMNIKGMYNVELNYKPMFHFFKGMQFLSFFSWVYELKTVIKLR